MQDLYDFLEPIHVFEISNLHGYNDGQLARHITIYENEIPDIDQADIVLVGINEERGNAYNNFDSHAPNIIRRQLYQLYYWHPRIKMVDLGNIKTGVTLTDTYAAVKTVLAEILRKKKTVIILGGSHDITLAQYYAYKEINHICEATCIDAMIDLKSESNVRSENFLLDMLTSEPNFVKHYNHIGFQSYYVHPRMLETMDKLRFDCFRVGLVNEKIEEMEPVIRNTNLLSLDVSAIKYSDAPASQYSANGLSGVDACTLTRYAGMSNQLSSLGVYGYQPFKDVNELTAKQIAQMIWYFMDGKNRAMDEPTIEDRENFNEFHTAFAEVESIFLQSKISNRWWMQLPNKKFIACSFNDYMIASHNDIPERWLRAQELTM
jgi:arginase family enzyme